MIRRRHYTKIFWGIGILLLGVYSQAQVDSTRKRTVEVTSTFKPVLHETAKINMNATPPEADTQNPGCNTVFLIKIYCSTTSREI